MLVDDLLFHRRGLDRFAAEVGPLLADRGRALVEEWRSSERRWWRVVENDDTAVRVCPAEGGEAVWAALPGPPDPDEATPDLRGLVLARVLPVGTDLHVAPGALTITDTPEPALTDLPDPDDIIGVRLWCAQTDRESPW